MKLSAAEETLMQHLWSRGEAYLKDLIDAYDDPKPAATTVATLLKRMTDKGFVAYRFFNNSAAQFASFFTTQTNLTADELAELRRIIDEQTNRQKP